MNKFRIAALALLFPAFRTLASQTLATAAASATTCKADPKTTCIAIFADGNVRQSLDKKESGTPASGSLGLTVFRHRAIITGQINVVDNADTVTSGFGSRLIAPGTGGTLKGGLVSFRRLPDLACTYGFGYHLYGSASSSRWSYKTDASGAPDLNGTVTETVEVGVLGLGALGTWMIARGTVGDNPVFLALDGGAAFRQVFGDIATRDNDALKRHLYQTSKEKFVGLEVGLNMQVGGLKGGLTYYLFEGASRGFTDGQILAGFSVQSSIFAGALK